MASAATSRRTMRKQASRSGVSTPSPETRTRDSNRRRMEIAAKTWHGKEWWKAGGGGSPWEGMSYDPGPRPALLWKRQRIHLVSCAPRPGRRSLHGLHLAVKASTGELAWYFQTTPGDSFDYDATQPLVQADLMIGGRLRKVVLQANKNGFFYVLDRQTGEFLSAAPFVSGITWASGVDAKTGRPIELPGVGGCEPKALVSRTKWSSQLEPDGVSPGYRTRLLPGASRALRWCTFPTRSGNMIRIGTTSGSTAIMKDRFSPK